MAVIKFDSEKADALIRDLNRISSELDSNFIKVYNIMRGKEINLTDAKLKVYTFIDKVIDIVQDDGTIVQETIKEKVLTNDFVANARIYNKHVRNMYSRSKTAKENAVRTIESVINSLNKVKSLISEYESETSVKMSSNLDDVGQFNFNFLAAYGPMSKIQNYSNSFGTIVADEAYTSLHLGILGQRPTSINLKKLEVFDGMLDIAKDNGLSYQEKFKKVRDLLVDNVLDIKPEDIREKTEMALENMINIAKSVDTIIDDNLKIENLVKIGIPVIEDYDGSLAVDITKVDDVLQNAVAMGAGVIGTGNIFSDGINIDLNKDGKNDIEIGGINDFIEKVINKDDGSTPESQDGINSEVALESGEDSSSVGIIDEQGSLEQQESSSIKGEDGVNSTDNGESEFVSNNEVGSPQDNVDNSVPSSDISDSNSENKKTEDNESSIVDDSTNSHVSEEGTNSSIVLEKNDNAENSVVEETVVDEEIKPSAEDIALDNDIQSTKIENDYKEIDVSESSELSYKNVENEGDVEKKGAGILAGAAGIGALSNININSGGDIPQVNGMAAGEILGMNIGNDSSTIGIALENIPNSSVSDGSVNTSSLVNSSVGGESTSDRGIVTKDNSLNKENTSGGSGKGGATLEDKSNQQEENVNVKNNSEEDNKTNTKKGLLGDASIAELEAKDKKEIRIATGASTATIISSGVLALLNVLPWLMLLLIFVTVVFYAGYRVKKNKDKDKRMKAMNDVGSPSTNKNVNSLEMVQNVSEVENNGVKQSVSGNGDEFSEQPYEPLRDGVTEIGVRSSENE